MCNVSMKCGELDTCTPQASGHHTDLSFVGGGCGLCHWEMFFFFFFPLQWGRLRVSLRLLRPQNGLSNINCKQMFLWSVCSQSCVSPSIYVETDEICTGSVVSHKRARLGQGCRNTILAVAVGAVLIMRLLTAKQKQRCNSLLFYISYLN